MNLFYSIVDPFPAYRSDIAELFGVELRKLGLETEWYMAGANQPQDSLTAYSGQKVNVPLPMAGRLHHLNRLSYWLTDFYHIIRQLRGKSDAIQCRDKYLSSLLAIAIAKTRGIPFFYWCSYPFPEHDAISVEQQSGLRYVFGRIKAVVRFALLYKWICQRADHVFVQSDRMKSDMHAYGIPLDKMTPVPMGVSARVFDWVRTNKVKVVPGRVIYLGTLAAVRQLDMLLEAFQGVKNELPVAQLMFVGDGDVPSERQTLLDIARDMGLENDVVFTGFVPMDAAWRLAASASVCVSPIFPSPIFAPASPTKLVEYLALGRPVVCNDHPEQSQIIAESGAGLCVAWSAPAFAKAILQLLRDPKAAEVMAANGPAWVARNRSYPIIAKAVWARYQSILEKAR